MPRPRDQRLYFELQGKLTQQEVDYNNMHQHHTIVRAPQGKVTKISNDQYHDSMDIAGYVLILRVGECSLCNFHDRQQHRCSHHFGC